MNKAVLLQLQQAKAKELEMRNNMRQVYDNMSYDDNEIKQDAESNSTKAPQTQEKEEKIDRFWAPPTKQTELQALMSNTSLTNWTRMD